jgi:hypothetical protein
MILTEQCMLLFANRRVHVAVIDGLVILLRLKPLLVHIELCETFNNYFLSHIVIAHE